MCLANREDRLRRDLSAPPVGEPGGVSVERGKLLQRAAHCGHLFQRCGFIMPFCAVKPEISFFL